MLLLEIVESADWGLGDSSANLGGPTGSQKRNLRTWGGGRMGIISPPKEEAHLYLHRQHLATVQQHPASSLLVGEDE